MEKQILDLWEVLLKSQDQTSEIIIMLADLTKLVGQLETRIAELEDSHERE